MHDFCINPCCDVDDVGVVVEVGEEASGALPTRVGVDTFVQVLHFPQLQFGRIHAVEAGGQDEVGGAQSHYLDRPLLRVGRVRGLQQPRIFFATSLCQLSLTFFRTTYIQRLLSNDFLRKKGVLRAVFSRRQLFFVVFLSII